MFKAKLIENQSYLLFFFKRKIIISVLLSKALTICYGQEEIIFQEMEENIPKYSIGNTIKVDNSTFQFVKKKGDLLILENNNQKCVFNSELKPIVKLRDAKKIEIKNYGIHIISNENQHGLYNKEGQVLIPIEMKYLRHFFDGTILTTDLNNQKRLFCIDEKRYSEKEYCEIKEFNLESKLVLASSDCNHFGISHIDSVDYLSNFEFTNPEYFYFNSMSGWILSKNEMRGVVLKNQKQIIPFKYDEIYNLRDFFIVRNNNKWGVVDKKDDELIPIEYSTIKSVNNYNLFKVTKEGKTGIVSIDYKIQIPTKYDNIEWNHHRNEYKVFREGKKGILNENGEVVIPLNYEVLEDNWRDGYVVSQNQKFGVISYSGKEIIPLKYHQINKLSKNRDYDTRGYHVLNSSIKSSFFDDKGVQKTEFIFDEYEIHGSQQPIKVKIEEFSFYVNAHGECVHECPEVSFLNKYGLTKSTESNKK